MMTDLFKEIVGEIVNETRLRVLREITKKLLDYGDNVDKVAKVTGLSIDEVEEILQAASLN